jgi:hypothetical protein
MCIEAARPGHLSQLAVVLQLGTFEHTACHFEIWGPHNDRYEEKNCFLGLLFNPEVGRRMFLQNTG